MSASDLDPSGTGVSAAGRRSRRAGRPPRVAGGVLVVLAIVSVLLVVALVIDVVAGPVVEAPAEPVAQDKATSGTWYCPSVGQPGERAFLSIASVADEPSRVIVQRFAGDGPRSEDARVIEPGRAELLSFSGDDATAPTTVSWSGGPVVASWRTDAISSSAAAPCEAHPSERWYVPGFSTVLGATSRLHLFNPFPGDAVVRITFGTPSGFDELALTDNIVVPAQATRTLDMADYKPQLKELAAIVDVLVGRVVAQGELVVKTVPRTPTTPGRTLLVAARAPAQRWSFAYALADSSGRSWLEVHNPGDRAAAVEVRVSNPLGRGSSLLGEVTAPPGAMTRIDLNEASRSSEFGVDVEVVNDVDIVVLRKTALSTGGGSSLAASLGATELSTEWGLAGAGTRERDAVVAVYNPGPEPATIDFTTPNAPRSWSGVRVRPNGRAQVLLSDAAPDAPTLAVRVQSDVPVVAEVRSLSDAGTRLWTALGVPASVWFGPTTRPAVQLDPGLPTRVDVLASESAAADSLITEPAIDPFASEPAVTPAGSPPAAEGPGG